MGPPLPRPPSQGGPTVGSSAGPSNPTGPGAQAAWAPPKGLHNRLTVATLKEAKDKFESRTGAGGIKRTPRNAQSCLVGALGLGSTGKQGGRTTALLPGATNKVPGQFDKEKAKGWAQCIFHMMGATVEQLKTVDDTWDFRDADQPKAKPPSATMKDGYPSMCTHLGLVRAPFGRQSGSPRRRAAKTASMLRASRPPRTLAALVSMTHHPFLSFTLPLSLLSWSPFLHRRMTMRRTTNLTIVTRAWLPLKMTRRASCYPRTPT